MPIKIDIIRDCDASLRMALIDPVCVSASPSKAPDLAEHSYPCIALIPFRNEHPSTVNDHLESGPPFAYNSFIF